MRVGEGGCHTNTVVALPPLALLGKCSMMEYLMQFRPRFCKKNEVTD